MRLWVIPAICLVICLSTAVTGTLHAQTINGVTVNVLPAPAETSGEFTTHGYREIRVALNNIDATADRQVTLTVPVGRDGRGGNTIRYITRTVKLAPKSNAVVSLPQPPLPLSNNGLHVDVNGESKDLQLYLSEHAAIYYSRGYENVYVLTTSASNDIAQQMASITAGHSQRFAMLRSELPIEQWSDQWLGYTRYDAVMLTDQQMRDLPVKVSEAIRRYVQSGGALIVIGPGWSVPESWGLHQKAADVAIDMQYVGFGLLVQLNSTRQAIVSNGQRLADLLALNSTVWSRRPDLNGANSRLPVVDHISIPVSGLLLLIITFAIVIGPVNLWVLSRKRRRMWLLWTVPLISLLTCGAIWGYSIFAEGWRGRCRTRTLTLLDQGNLTATTLGWAGYYAPLTPADGLHFSADTEVTPLIERYYYRSSSGSRARSVDMTRDQHLASGWIVARVPAYFMLRNTATPVRQRMVFASNEDGSVSVTNGLGVTVQHVIYVDHAGKPYELATPLPAGEKTKMNPLPGEVQELNMLRVHELFPGNWMDNFDRLDLCFTGRDPLKSGIRPFGPDMYLALTDAANPFLQPGLSNLSKQQHQTYILGITEPQTTTGTNTHP